MIGIYTMVFAKESNPMLPVSKVLDVPRNAPQMTRVLLVSSEVAISF